MVFETGPETAMSLFEMAHDSFKISNKKWPTNIRDIKLAIKDVDFFTNKGAENDIVFDLDINSDQMNSSMLDEKPIGGDEIKIKVF